MNADTKVSMEMQQIATEIQASLEGVAGKRMAFSLLVFQAEPGSRMNYVSNCDRSEVIAAMESLLNGWKLGMPDVPAHKAN